MRCLLITICVNLICFAIPAQSIAKASSCHTVSNDLDRLACYDRETGRTPKITPNRVDKGAWQSNSETSALTDRTNVYLSVKSDEKVNCGWNRPGSRTQLYIVCHDNRTRLYFHTNCHMTSGQHTTLGVVNYRLDKDPARKISMLESNDHRSLGLWRGSTAIPMIKRMFGKSRLLAQMTPYGENSFAVNFDITGLSSAIKPLRKACNW